MKHALIVSDDKPGHFNQSIALCKHLGWTFERVEVAYKGWPQRGLSYLLDFLNIHPEGLFDSIETKSPAFDVVVSAGSTPCCANKLLAKKYGVPNIGLLYPRGYRQNFTHIFCPFYDHPPKRKNLTEIPLNLCAADESFFNEKTAEFKTRHTPQKPAVGIVIGGPNAISTIDPTEMEQQLERIFEATEGMERWITTSRRTPKQIDAVVDGFTFDYKLINSRDSFNPVPAFIQLCDRLFVTSDSASMVSECASFGSSKVEILMNRQLKSPNKFEELIRGLEARNAVHVFDGTLGNADQKVDLGAILKAAITF